MGGPKAPPVNPTDAPADEPPPAAAKDEGAAPPKAEGTGTVPPAIDPARLKVCEQIADSYVALLAAWNHVARDAGVMHLPDKMLVELIRPATIRVADRYLPQEMVSEATDALLVVGAGGASYFAARKAAAQLRAAQTAGSPPPPPPPPTASAPPPPNGANGETRAERKPFH